MPKIALALASLAWIDHGRGLHKADAVRVAPSHRQVSTKCKLTQLQALATLLAACTHSAAFSAPAAASATAAKASLAPAVVIGAGPAGLATAWALSQRGFNVTVLERREEPSPYEPQRAYLYLIDRRGQKFTDAAQITDELKAPELSVASENYTVTRCFADGKCTELVPPILEPSKDGRTSYWIPRQVFLALLCRLLAGNERVRTLYGSEVQSLKRTADGGVEVSVQTSSPGSAEATVSSMRPVLLVGADGLNSVVREHMAAWSADDPSLDAKTHEFVPVVLPSPSSGLKYKMLRFPPSFRLETSNGSVTSQPRKGYSIRPSENAPFGEVRLGMLPVANETYPRTANVILPPDHPVWSLSSVEAVREWLKATFPQLPIDEIVSKEEANEFVAGKPGVFPAPCYTPRQQLLLPSAAVCLVGDAIHAFPPDIGQGVNSALSDVMHLGDALDAAAPEAAGGTHAWLGRAMAAYGKRASAEAKAVAKIAQVGFPYQYSHTVRDGLLPRLRKFFWFLNFALRTLLLSKLPFRIFSPAAIVLVQRPNLSYGQVWQLAAATTRRIAAVSALLLFLLSRRFLPF